MLGIKIDKNEAISEIMKGQSKVSSNLINLKGNYKKINNLLVESEGEFVESIKKQLETEEIAVDALINMLAEFYNTLEKTVAGFEEQDRKLSIGLKFKIKDERG